MMCDNEVLIVIEILLDLFHMSPFYTQRSVAICTLAAKLSQNLNRPTCQGLTRLVGVKGCYSCQQHRKSSECLLSLVFLDADTFRLFRCVSILATLSNLLQSFSSLDMDMDTQCIPATFVYTLPVRNYMNLCLATSMGNPRFAPFTGS